MNTLLIALAVFVSATIATLHWQTQRHAAGVELRRLQADTDALRGQLEALQTSRDEAARGHQGNVAELAATEEELRKARTAATERRTEPDPAGEGMWPTNQPYFYLPKRLLREVDFDAVTREGQPTPQAAALLGLTRGEQKELQRAWADFQSEVQDIQAHAAERIPGTDTVVDPNRRSIQFRLSDITDDLTKLQSRLDQRLQNSLGSTRASLLAEPLKERARDLVPPIGGDGVLITYSAQRMPDGSVQHWLRFDDPTRQSMHQYPVLFPGVDVGITDGEAHAVSGLKFPLSSDSPLWNYRHLFGDQPLLKD